MKTSINTYTHLVQRVEYPRERGYRMEAYPTPHTMYLTITEKDNSKFLTVHSKIHKNKEIVMNPSYSCDFSDQEIIKDLSAEIHQRFIK